MTFLGLFTAVGRHLVQSTIFAAVVWGLVRTVFRQSGPRTRYGLWLAASVKFLVPFDALAVAGAQFVAGRQVPYRLTQQLDLAVDQIARRVPTPLLPSAPFVALPDSRVSPLPWLAIIWACGAAILAVRWWIQWRTIRAAARASSPLLVWSGLPVQSVPVSSRRPWEPGLFGLMRPVVLVPAGIRERLTPEQFEAVVAHEKCHADRRDNLTATVHAVVETVFWFHPLVWWLGSRLRDERERACDEGVIRRGADPDVYAEGLLRVCRFYVDSPLLSVSGVSGANLKQRIEDIMTGRLSGNLSRLQRALLIGATASVLVGPMLLGHNGAVASAQIAAAFTGLQTSAVRTFEVTSVKVNNSGDNAWRLGAPNRQGEAIVNLELRKILASSFRIQDKMVLGGPGWLDATHYDIVAKTAVPESDVVVWEMMRSLLADRFQLKYHVETREMPVYALSIAKGGPKLTDPTKGACGDALRAGRDCGRIRYPAFGIAIDNMPMGALTAVLARRLQDRPVVDDTGLTALYDATVRWMPDDMTPDQRAALPEDVRPPDVGMFEAFAQQAGLKLEATRRPVRVVVVDSIQPADPN